MFQMRELRSPPAPPGLGPLLSDPPSQPEVGHLGRHLHHGAAEEAGHGRHCEQLYPTPPSLPPAVNVLSRCFRLFPDDGGLAVHRPGGGPPLPLVVCHHHHPGNPGRVPGRQL